MEWNLIPFKGITSDSSKIMLGQSRTLVRKGMVTAFGKPVSDTDYPDEDDFITPDRTTFIRVRYQGKVERDIEFLSGSLRYNGVELHDGTTLRRVRKFLKSESASLRPTKWLGDGFDCVELGINIASHRDVGGDGDGVEWVIMGSNFKVDEPLYVDCGPHGKQVGAVVCCHMLQSSTPVGFVENSSDPDDLQAWCDSCEEMFLTEGDKTKEFEAFNDRAIVCCECYAALKAQHCRQHDAAAKKQAAKLFQAASQDARGARQKLLKGLMDRDPLVRHVSAIELAKRWPKELTEASIRELLETLARDLYGEPSPFDDDYTEVTVPQDEDEDGGELGQDIMVAFSYLNFGQADFVIPRLLEFWSFGCENYELGDALLALSFPTSDCAVDPDTLSGRQENVLKALVAQPLIWGNHGSWKSTLARYGLPRTLVKMRKFLGYR